MSIWDDPELQVSNDYVRFDYEGDTITCDILSIRAHRFDNGKVAPQLLVITVNGNLAGQPVEPGKEKTLTAGQVRLKAKLAELRPEGGDRITITMTRLEKRAGGKELKDFDVDVERGAGRAALDAASTGTTSASTGSVAQATATTPATPPATTQAAAPAPATPVAAAPAPDAERIAAAIAALSEDQKKALGFAS